LRGAPQFPIGTSNPPHDPIGHSESKSTKKNIYCTTMNYRGVNNMLYVHVQPDGFTTCSRFPSPAAGHTHSHVLSRTAICPFLHSGIPPRLCMLPFVRTTCSLFRFASAYPSGHPPSTGSSSTPPAVPYVQTCPCGYSLKEAHLVQISMVSDGC